MLKKLCKCGKSIPINQTVCDSCKKNFQTNYDKFERKNTEIYKSKRWKKLTEQCKDRCNGLDIYAYYKYKRLTPGKISHHIIEVNEDKNKVFDINNLIFVSDRSHKEIHERYKHDKRECQEELKKYIEKYTGEGQKV